MVGDVVKHIPFLTWLSVCEFLSNISNGLSRGGRAFSLSPTGVLNHPTEISQLIALFLNLMIDTIGILDKLNKSLRHSCSTNIL